MNKLSLAALGAAALSLSACATIIDSGSEPVTFNSNPAGAEVEVVNADGMSVFTGTTPATTELKNGDGFFKPAEYTVTYTAPGYEPAVVQIASDEFNSWTIGNIVFGGLIGLAVDASTGAMWRFSPSTINQDLTAGSALQVQIVPLDTLSEEQRATMVRVN